MFRASNDVQVVFPVQSFFFFSFFLQLSIVLIIIISW